MAHFFGADPVAFYDTAINTDIPDDAVEITADEHAALLVAQARGKRIAAGKDGRPILLDPPAPTRDELGELRTHLARRTVARNRLTSCPAPRRD